MIYISHRGNINGKFPNRENSPEYIMEAIHKGYNVEIDAWVFNNKWFLGHDTPQYKIKREFLYQPGLWVHAKNLDALFLMLQDKDIHCFYHQNDNFTINH